MIAQLGDHIHERHEILDPKRAATGRQHNERVDVRSIRPAARQRALHAILIEERHAILTPRLTHSHERELATTPRMKRMRHTDSPLRNTPIKRSRQAKTKGGVEGEVGRYRRNHLVPVPSVGSSAQLNRAARRRARGSQPADRRAAGHGRLSAGRRAAAAAALPREPFDATRDGALRVDQKALVTVRQNRYSVPVALAGLRVSARDRRDGRSVSATGGREVARHERLARQVRHARDGSITTSSCSSASPARSPARCRWPRNATAAHWPGRFDELWAALRARTGASEADKQMVDVLMLCREHGPATVELAVRGVLAAGAIDGRAVGVLARRAESAPLRRRR